jgi:plastocyanin
MRIFPFLLFVLLAIPRPVPAGEIFGSVRAQGKAGVANDPSCGKYEGREFKFVQRVDYDAMRDFIVYLEGTVPGVGIDTNSRATVVTSRNRVEQKGAMFQPHVLPVVVGTTVAWPNNDDILHNVFSVSETKAFDLDLYKAPEVKSTIFEKAGRVDVFCSIHTRMSCIVLVLENPFFAATSEKGNYRIKNIPAGVYKFKAWHERLPAETREITVPQAGEVRADFTLGIKNLPPG